MNKLIALTIFAAMIGKADTILNVSFLGSSQPSEVSVDLTDIASEGSPDGFWVSVYQPSWSDGTTLVVIDVDWGLDFAKDVDFQSEIMVVDPVYDAYDFFYQSPFSIVDASIPGVGLEQLHDPEFSSPVFLDTVRSVPEPGTFVLFSGVITLFLLLIIRKLKRDSR